MKSKFREIQNKTKSTVSSWLQIYHHRNTKTQNLQKSDKLNSK